jgi:hypothetical protein
MKHPRTHPKPKAPEKAPELLESTSNTKNTFEDHGTGGGSRPETHHAAARAHDVPEPQRNSQNAPETRQNTPEARTRAPELRENTFNRK